MFTVVEKKAGSEKERTVLAGRNRCKSIVSEWKVRRAREEVECSKMDKRGKSAANINYVIDSSRWRVLTCFVFP